MGAGRPVASVGSTLPWAGTFHSVGARLLRRLAERVGLTATFTIHDRTDAEDLMGLAREDALDAATRKSRFPAAATCLAIYSRAVNCQSSLAAIVQEYFPWCAHVEEQLGTVFSNYVTKKQAQQILDFDDLLLYWAGMMNVPELANEVGALFDCVLVDEYQDTNVLQATILRLLKPDGRGLTVVGDDAQAIYSFRAATVRNILDFPRQYDPPAAVITLSRNYRSTQPILNASNAVIGLAKERYTKDLSTQKPGGEQPRLVTVQDEASQAQYVAERVLEHRECGIALKDQSVLFRASSHSAQLELELARRNIPFVKFGGLRFLDSAHIKDVLSILRWIDNPRGKLAGSRTLRLLPGVGPGIANRCLEAIEGATDFLTVMRIFQMPPAAAAYWARLLELYDLLHSSCSEWPAELDAVLSWYESRIEDIYEDAQIRMLDLTQLQRIAATYPNRERFLTELTLDPPTASSTEAGPPLLDEDYLALSTIHSAKGQEWKVVHVLNLIDGCIPSDMATSSEEGIEEERRVLYVAMTRAKDYLTLLLPQRFYVRQQGNNGDRHVYAVRSRLLSDSICGHFQQETWPTAGAGDVAKTVSKGARTVDLQAVLKQSWEIAKAH